MSVIFHPRQLLQYAHAAFHNYELALEEHGQDVFDRYGISVSALRAAHFTAQVMHESCALTASEENLRYSAQRLVEVWPTHFKPRGHLDPHAFADKPEALGNTIYVHDNGNNQPGDGYAFRGGGLLQLTGRRNYHAATLALRADNAGAPDLCATPSLVCDPAWALAVAGSFWKAARCNEFADRDRLDLVTRAINGGENGLNARRIWLGRMKKVYGVQR